MSHVDSHGYPIPNAMHVYYFSKILKYTALVGIVAVKNLLVALDVE